MRFELFISSRKTAFVDHSPPLYVAVNHLYHATCLVSHLVPALYRFTLTHMFCVITQRSARTSSDIAPCCMVPHYSSPSLYDSGSPSQLLQTILGHYSYVVAVDLIHRSDIISICKKCTVIPSIVSWDQENVKMSLAKLRKYAMVKRS